MKAIPLLNLYRLSTGLFAIAFKDCEAINRNESATATYFVKRDGLPRDLS